MTADIDRRSHTKSDTLYAIQTDASRDCHSFVCNKDELLAESRIANSRMCLLPKLDGEAEDICHCLAAKSSMNWDLLGLT